MDCRWVKRHWWSANIFNPWRYVNTFTTEVVGQVHISDGVWVAWHCERGVRKSFIDQRAAKEYVESLEMRGLSQDWHAEVGHGE